MARTSKTVKLRWDYCHFVLEGKLEHARALKYLDSAYHLLCTEPGTCTRLEGGRLEDCSVCHAINIISEARRRVRDA
jgi:hypothetical protein